MEFIAGPAGGLQEGVGELLDRELERIECRSESETAVMEGRQPHLGLSRMDAEATSTPGAAHGEKRLKACYPIRLVTPESHLESTKRILAKPMRLVRESTEMPETAAIIDQVRECKTMPSTGTRNPAPGTIAQVRATPIEVFEPLLTAEEAAARLRMHTKTLQRYAREGRVPCIRQGKYWRFRLSSLDLWVRSHENQSQPAVPREGMRRIP
jgi:excisionase family DNA binding protein